MSDTLSPAQELIALRASATTAAADLQAANDLLAEAQASASAEKARADAAEASASAEKARADGLQEKLTASEGTVGALTQERDGHKTRADAAEANVRHADQRHAEQLASRGIAPVQKAATPEGVIEEAKPTAASLKAQYAAIEDKDARYAFFQKHKAVLMA